MSLSVAYYPPITCSENSKVDTKKIYTVSKKARMTLFFRTRCRTRVLAMNDWRVSVQLDGPQILWSFDLGNSIQKDLRGPIRKFVRRRKSRELVHIAGSLFASISVNKDSQDALNSSTSRLMPDSHRRRRTRRNCRVSSRQTG